MFENLYTTKMSEGRKRLENRFTKILTNGNKRSRIPAVIISVILLCAAICTTVVLAAADNAIKEPDKITDDGALNTLINEEPVIMMKSEKFTEPSDDIITELPTVSDSKIINLPYPCEGTLITNEYGEKVHPINGTYYHSGIDIKAEHGSNVYAVSAGSIAEAEFNTSDGYYILLEGEDFNSKYAHLSELSVNKGETVEAGEVIGKVGQTGDATGPHLHFEVIVDGDTIDPVTVLEAAE